MCFRHSRCISDKVNEPIIVDYIFNIERMLEGAPLSSPRGPEVAN